MPNYLLIYYLLNKEKYFHQKVLVIFPVTGIIQKDRKDPAYIDKKKSVVI